MEANMFLCQLALNNSIFISVNNNIATKGKQSLRIISNMYTCISILLYNITRPCTINRLWAHYVHWRISCHDKQRISFYFICFNVYNKTSNISHAWLGNTHVDHTNIDTRSLRSFRIRFHLYRKFGRIFGPAMYIIYPMFWYEYRYRRRLTNKPSWFNVINLSHTFVLQHL